MKNDMVSVEYAPQEVPETRLGDDFIGRKDAHTVDLGDGLIVGGEMAPNDLVFGESHLEGEVGL